MYLIEIKNEQATQKTFRNDQGEQIPYYRQTATAHMVDGQQDFEFGVGADSYWKKGFYLLDLESLQLTNQGGGFGGGVQLAKPGKRINLLPVPPAVYDAIQAEMKKAKAA